MVYITGDCHAEWDKFSSSRFKEGKSLTRDDFVIVCGDFGIWTDDKRERYWLDWLSEKPFTILFVDGNHENFDRLYSNEFEVVDFHGGKAHKIRDNIYHLMRGYVFELCGKKFFAFGGASSHDIQDGILDRDDFESDEEFDKKVAFWYIAGMMFRINHKSWWKQEMPSEEEMKFGFHTLSENNNEVDYIITHCAATSITSVFSHGLYKPDELTEYFERIKQTVKYDKWFCGHYHMDEAIDDKHIIFYDKICRII